MKAGTSEERVGVAVRVSVIWIEESGGVGTDWKGVVVVIVLGVAAIEVTTRMTDSKGQDHHGSKDNDYLKEKKKHQ